MSYTTQNLAQEKKAGAKSKLRLELMALKPNSYPLRLPLNSWMPSELRELATEYGCHCHVDVNANEAQFTRKERNPSLLFPEYSIPAQPDLFPTTEWAGKVTAHLAAERETIIHIAMGKYFTLYGANKVKRVLSSVETKEGSTLAIDGKDIVTFYTPYYQSECGVITWYQDFKILI